MVSATIKDGCRILQGENYYISKLHVKLVIYFNWSRFLWIFDRNNQQIEDKYTLSVYCPEYLVTYQWTYFFWKNDIEIWKSSSPQNPTVGQRIATYYTWSAIHIHCIKFYWKWFCHYKKKICSFQKSWTLHYISHITF